MEKEFEFIPTTVYIERLKIKDIGNCIIEAEAINHSFYYLTISTNLGLSKICKIGPMSDIPEVTYNSSRFSFSYIEVEYNEKKLIKQIDDFLKAPFIDKAYEISYEDLIARLQLDLAKFIKE